MNSENSANNKTCFFACFYRSPSQNHDKLNDFCYELILCLTNVNNNQPACSVLLVDFNVKYSRAGWKLGNPRKQGYHGKSREENYKLC